MAIPVPQLGSTMRGTLPPDAIAPSGPQPIVNTGDQMLYTIPGQGPGSPSNTIDLNKVDEAGLAELIGIVGPQKILTDRLGQMQKTRVAQEQADAEAKQQALQDQIQQRLNSGMDSAFQNAANFAGSNIERQFAPVRQKSMSQEAALGRLNSPVSAYTSANLDTAQANALSNVLGSLASQRASGQADLSKYLESALAGVRDSAQQANQFQQAYDLKKNQFQAEINEAAANRALSSDLARARMQHETDLATPDDFTKWNSRISGGLDTFSKMFPLTSSGDKPGGRGGDKSKDFDMAAQAFKLMV